MEYKQILKQRSIAFYTLWGIVTGSMFVVMPLYSEYLNFSFKQISIFVAIPNITLLFQPLWAFVIDYFQNHRKIVTLTTLFAAIAILMLRVVVNFQSIVILYFGYSLLINPLWITIDNIIFNVCDERNMIYGKIRNFASFAYGASVIILLPLLAIIPLENYFVLAFMIYVLIIIAICKLPNSTNNCNHQVVTKSDITKLFLNHELQLLLLFSTLYGSLVALTIPYQTLLFTAAGKSIKFIAFATFITLIFEGLLLNTGAKFYKLNGLKKTLCYAVIALLIRSIMLPNVESSYILLTTSSLFGVSTAFYIPLLMAYTRQVAGDALSNSALMFANFCSSIGAIIVTYIVSTFAIKGDIELFYKLSVVVLIAAIFVISMMKEPKRKEKKDV